MYLKINGKDDSRQLETGENKAVFHLPAGKARLDIWMQEQGKPRILFTENDATGDVDVRLLKEKK